MSAVTKKIRPKKSEKEIILANRCYQIELPFDIIQSDTYNQTPLQRRHTTAHTIKTIKPSCLPENFILRLKLWAWCGGWMVGVGRLFWLLV